jgi:ERF superfamily
MNEVQTVAKRGVNEFHRYRYATMGDILQEITPLLGRHGLVIFQSETGRAMFDEDNVIAIEYAFTVAHASGETWPQAIKQTGVSTCRNSKGGWDDKSLNKCHTAARKYFLLSLFQIPTGEEDDADQSESFDKSSGKRPAKVIERVPVPARIQRNLDRIAQQPGAAPAKVGGIADRAMVARAHQSWARPAGPSKPFLASEAGKEFYSERNPPPHDGIPEFLDRRAATTKETAKALNRRLHPMNDELPEFT